MTKTAIQLRPLKLADQALFPEAVRLLNRTQGEGLFKPDYLEQLVSRDDAVVIAAFEMSKIIGLGVAQIINNFDYYLRFDPQVNERFKDLKVGSFSTLCFQEGYRGQGLGQKIGQARLQWLQEQACDVVVGVSWLSGLAHTSDRVFQKLGFTPVAVVENFYLADTYFVCPACQKPPCVCSAQMYRKQLK